MLPKPEGSTINIFSCDRPALEAVTQYFHPANVVDADHEPSGGEGA